MTKILKYRIHCTTDAIDEYWWLEEGASAPTTCPTDGAHSVDLSSVAQVNSVGPNEVVTDLRVGKEKTLTAGIVIADACPANEWRRAELTLPEDLHLAQALVIWVGMKVHDYGFATAIHPGGDSLVQTQIEVSGTTVDVDTGLGAYYDPLGGAVAVEFWDGNAVASSLKEVRKIASRTGDQITLSEGVSNQVLTTWYVRACYEGFALDEGATHIDGGMRLLGTSSWSIGNVHEITQLMTAGLALGMRFKAGAGTGTRDLVTNFIFRRPLV